MKKQITKDNSLISHCGFYCGACPEYLKDTCEGCRGDTPHCSTGNKKCQVKRCCSENNYFTCADCQIYSGTQECKIYNPLSIRLGEYLSCTSRKKGIEMIKEKGIDAFSEYMVDKEWVTIKTKDNFLNKKLGKPKN